MGCQRAAGPACGSRIRVLISLAGMVQTAAFYEREFGGLVAGKDNLWDEPDYPLSEAFAMDLRGIGDVLSAAVEMKIPCLFLHGADDDFVPVQDSRDAYATASGPKKVVEVPGAGHSFDENTYPVLVERTDAWLSASFG